MKTGSPSEDKLLPNSCFSLYFCPAPSPELLPEGLGTTAAPPTCILSAPEPGGAWCAGVHWEANEARRQEGNRSTSHSGSGAKTQSGFQAPGAGALSATPALSRAWYAGQRGLSKVCQKGYGPMQFSGLPIFNTHGKNITKHIKSVIS